jgi:hypothetical protein
MLLKQITCYLFTSFPFDKFLTFSCAHVKQVLLPPDLTDLPMRTHHTGTTPPRPEAWTWMGS